MDPTKAPFLKMLQAQQRIINSLCTVYYPDAEDLKDARQDVILQLWKAWPQFRGESEISTWVYRIGLNTLLNKKRKESRRLAATSLSSNKEQLALTAPAANDDDLQLLKQFIGWLGNLEKAIVVLHLEGYKYQEIAQMLHLSASNVSTRMNRIKIKLKQYHQQHTHAPE